MVGTVPYMSPEQASGRRVDARSDQFSLGVILHEMMTGKLAFRRESLAQTMAAIIEDEPEPISSINPAAPAELIAIVARCLRKDPEERHQSTAEVAKALKGVPETSKARQARRSLLWSAARLLVLFLVLALGVKLDRLREWMVTRARPSPVQSVAVLPLHNLSGDPEQQYLADGMTEALISDLLARSRRDRLR